MYISNIFTDIFIEYFYYGSHISLELVNHGSNNELTPTFSFQKKFGVEILAQNMSYKMQSLFSIYRDDVDQKFCLSNLNPTIAYPFINENFR